MNNFHMREGKVEFRWKRWRNKKRQEVSSCLMVLFSGMVLLGAGGVALAGPTGGQITGGTGSINQTGPTTNVDQTSNVLNINWQDFSIGVNETVNFNQPDANALAINRVIGGVPSQLAGALNANGRVFILNSAGITFTGTSHVNVGALLATTAMTVNGDPTQAASYSGSGYGSVINQGSIAISNGGFAILAAPYVQNTGFIKADLGTIALAGTNQFTLDLSGTGLINFVVPAGTVEQIVADGKALGVDNSGTLQARSGQVIISANVATQVVNAVVNLNGVVDADAFAPNGTGGSVLVTGAGDINIGGQVTARGDGAGNGGQIVTKAGGADAIEALAFVSAAGGAAGGKGGFIEVSGKTVGLNGNIDPGSGGSLFIDPFNIIVVAANGGLGTLSPGSNVAGSLIGTDFIENELQGGVNVNLQANHNVEFQPFADDHRLVGGAGNFTITAGATGEGGNIIVDGTNDAIVQGGGFIHMNANGGSIGLGTPGHALSLITGVGNADVGDAIGLTQAGDIVLKAGHDIHVKNVQIKSSGGSAFTALFSANAGGGDFTATGDINVQAIAHGGAQQTASATVNIFAQDNITTRNITVIAHATQNAASNTGADAHAIANLQLAASSSIRVNRNITLNAFASDAARLGDAHANAQANVQANADANVTGDVGVLATARQHSSSGDSALACANLELQGYGPTGSVNVNGDIAVDALAQASGSKASANALGTVYAAHDINISGNVHVGATANQLGSSGNTARACANMQLGASSSLNVDGNIGVDAVARASGGGVASANAEGNVYAGDELDIGGSVDVSANANHLGSSGDNALACANLALQAPGSNVNVGGDIGAHAFAQASGDGANAVANAVANVYAGNDIRLGGVDVSANAKQLGGSGSNAIACANLVLFASTGVNVHNDISVDAFALTSGSGNASASAQGDIFAVCNIAVGGDVYVGATANEAGDSGSHARACANLLIDVATYAGGTININGDIAATANAFSRGSESAIANANIRILAVGSAADITVNGVVTANAHAVASSSSACNGALALASIDVEAVHRVTLGGLDAEATATSHGTGNASAIAFANVLGSQVTVGNAIVRSRASGHGGTAVSKATLLLNDSSFIDVTGSINVEADMVASGFGPLGANALASLNGSHITVEGPIRVVANTKGSNATGSVFANAELIVNALHNVHFESAVDVEAHVDGIDAPLFNAHPRVFFNATSVEVDNTLKVLADANGASGTSVNAIPILDFNAAPKFLFNGIDLEALAHGNGVTHVLANAQLTYTGVSPDFHDRGQTKLHAKASGTGIHDDRAVANLTLDMTNNIAFDGGIDVEASANASHAHSIMASAFANLTANDRLTFGNDVTVQADATGSFATKITAQALALLTGDKGIDVTSGDVAVRANVTASHSVSFGTAAAVASLDALSQNGGEHFAGDVDVTVNVVYETPSSVYSSLFVPFGPGFFNSHFVTGNVFALANAQLQANDGNISVDGNIDVEAKLRSNARNLGTASAPGFGQGSNYFEQTAGAFLNVQDHHGNIRLHGVTDKATADLDGNGIVFGSSTFLIAGGIALASINAPNGSVSIDGPLDVEAQMTAGNEGFHTFSKVTAVGALAAVNVEASNQIHTKDVTVNAYASASSMFVCASFGIADAVAFANFTAGSTVKIDGNVDVTANYNGFNGTDIFAGAFFHVNAHNEWASINGNLHVAATANLHSSECHFGGLTCHELAVSLASIEAGTGASITGNALVTAKALGLTAYDTALADANLTIDAPSIVVQGGIDVEALTDVPFGQNVLAEAIASLDGFDGIEVDGNIKVTASALTSFIGAGNVAAEAFFAALANSGSVSIGGGVDVLANARDDGTGYGVAYAKAGASINAEFGVHVGGTVAVEAVLLDRSRNGDTFDAKFGPFGSFSGTGGLASAQVNIHDEFSGGVSLGGLSVKASADVVNTEFGISSPTTALANAVANAQVVSSDGSITITGNVVGSAFAHDAGDGGANAVALIDLEPGASLGGASSVNLHIGGNVAMNATAEGDIFAEGQVVAIAVLNADADGGKVLIDGNVGVNANAQDLTFFPFKGEKAAAYANANLEGDSGVSVGGGVTATAVLNTRAPDGAGSSSIVGIGDESFTFHFGQAEAYVQAITSSGDVHIGGVARASASAVGQGEFGGPSHFVAATGSVFVQAAGKINLGGAVANAFASGQSASDAYAKAVVDLDASSGSIFVSPNGLFAIALANAPDASHASANALIEADAGQSVFIQGNVISVAGALSGGPSNFAHANVHLAAGGGTEFGTGGTPSNFGNVVVIGDIEAIAFADPVVGDRATASVEIFAHNNILLIGDDPIASARVGPSGSIFAFRQAGFTTNSTAFGPEGRSIADIDIRAGETVTVIPLSSLIDAEKLFALPVDEPTLGSSGLTIIPLSVEGQDCGVLGIAGANANAADRAKNCHKGPINVSDLTDVSP